MKGVWKEEQKKFSPNRQSKRQVLLTKVLDSSADYRGRRVCGWGSDV